MIFTSLQFVQVFAVVYVLYRLLPHRGQNWMLLGASYVFYGFWDWRFLSLLWGSTIVDFLVARYLGRETNQGKRRAAPSQRIAIHPALPRDGPTAHPRNSWTGPAPRPEGHGTAAAMKAAAACTVPRYRDQPACGTLHDHSSVGAPLMRIRLAVGDHDHAFSIGHQPSSRVPP